jgi:hypothetical protein
LLHPAVATLNIALAADVPSTTLAVLVDDVHGAATAGSSSAQLKLAECYEDSSTLQALHAGLDEGNALAWVYHWTATAAAQHHPSAMAKLAAMHLAGENNRLLVDVDVNEAHLLLLHAGRAEKNEQHAHTRHTSAVMMATGGGLRRPTIPSSSPVFGLAVLTVEAVLPTPPDNPPHEQETVARWVVEHESRTKNVVKVSDAELGRVYARYIRGNAGGGGGGDGGGQHILEDGSSTVETLIIPQSDGAQSMVLRRRRNDGKLTDGRTGKLILSESQLAVHKCSFLKRRGLSPLEECCCVLRCCLG